MKLVIGSGPVAQPEKDVIYLDCLAFQGVTIVRDIEKGLPFDNRKFDKIEAHHVLEHINDLVFVMNELHRVLKTKGILDIIVPFGQNAWIDPTHKRAFTEHGFNFWLTPNIGSITVGVGGWFKLKGFDFLYHNEDKGDIRGLHFVLEKKENAVC